MVSIEESQEGECNIITCEICGREPDDCGMSKCSCGRVVCCHCYGFWSGEAVKASEEGRKPIGKCEVCFEEEMRNKN